MFSAAGHLRIEHRDGATVVSLLDREVRGGTVEVLRPSLLNLIDEGSRRVVLNLEHVAFLESSALGLIIQLGTKLSNIGVRLHLCGANADVRRLFTGPPLLPYGFPLFADADSAVAASGG